MRHNDEMDNFAEKEDSVAIKCCIMVRGDKEDGLIPASAEVKCFNFSVDLLIKYAVA
jgi:hypothetical protein